MKMNKEKYVTPQVELIVVETEACCVAASFGNGAADDAASTPGVKKTSYFNASNPFLRDEE